MIAVLKIIPLRIWLLSLVLLWSSSAAPAQDSLPVKNFHYVSHKLYRSAQPKRKAFTLIDTAGFTDVINLRTLWSDINRAGATSLNLHHVRVNTRRMNEADLLAVFKIIRKAKGKVLVHCWHGSDRTGTVIAMYRILYDGWSKEQALEEMQYGAYGFHPMFQNLPRLIREIDIEAFKKKIAE